MPNGKLKYSIVIPVRNEEQNIGNALDSIIRQTLPPTEVIVVNDNSTDNTLQILERYAKGHPFIKVVSTGTKKDAHEPGSKIVNAFYKGFNGLQSDWDVISKLDADVILPQNYFETIIDVFENDPRTGIAGGVIMIQKEGEWMREVHYKDKIRGAVKSYSRECFEEIGGLKRSIGWDTVDGILADYHGYKNRVIPELEVRLQRPTAKKYKKILGEKMGQAYYRMRYGIPISFVSAAKASKRRKSVVLFFAIVQGYFQSALKSDRRIVSKKEGKHIRKYRWKGMLSHFH